MNFKKLLALLLALAMLLCCFAACDSSDKDDDDEDEKVEEKDKDEDEDDKDKDDEDDDDKSSKDEEDDEDDEDVKDKEDEEDEDKKPSKPSKDEELTDEALIEGEWYLVVDVADIIFSNTTIKVDESLELCLVYEFDGEGEYHYSLNDKPSSGEINDFIDAYLEGTINYYMEKTGCSDMDEFEELVLNSDFESLDAYEDEVYNLVSTEINTMINTIDTEYDDDYEYDSEEEILVIEGIEYNVDMNSRGTEMEIVDSDSNPAFVGFVFEKQ